MKRKGLADRIRSLFSGGPISDETFDDLEDALIEGDVGVQLAMETVDALREDRGLRNSSRDEIANRIKELLRSHVAVGDLGLEDDRLNFVLVLGVNGVGKTTAIARIAHTCENRFGAERIVLCAGDTFRAGAVDQISVHGERLGVRVVKQRQGADAGAVIFDAIESAKAHNAELVIADTAGRMHNKRDLIEELAKIDRIITTRAGDAGYHKLLVIDATTGQNALRQAEVFHEAIGVDSVFLAKYDSSGKGGIALSIYRSLGIPVSFLGIGETYDAIVPFDIDDYLDTLVG